MDNVYIIYVTNNGYLYFYDYVIKVLIPTKNYFYDIFVNICNFYYHQIPTNKYINYKNYHL